MAITYSVEVQRTFFNGINGINGITRMNVGVLFWEKWEIWEIRERAVLEFREFGEIAVVPDGVDASQKATKRTKGLPSLSVAPGALRPLHDGDAFIHLRREGTAAFSCRYGGEVSSDLGAS